MPSTKLPASAKLLTSASVNPYLSVITRPYVKLPPLPCTISAASNPLKNLYCQQELWSPGSTVQSQRIYPNASVHCSAEYRTFISDVDPLASTGELTYVPICDPFYILANKAPPSKRKCTIRKLPTFPNSLRTLRRLPISIFPSLTQKQPEYICRILIETFLKYQMMYLCIINYF